MRVLVKRSNVRKALSLLRTRLETALPRESDISWSFPGYGMNDTDLATRTTAIGAPPLTVALGVEGSWGHRSPLPRTPLLLAAKAPAERLCPHVEVNIPVTDGAPYRLVNGCFGRDESGQTWLLHRGASFTASGGRVTKAVIHALFAADLVDVVDGLKLTPVIPVACLDAKDFVRQLRRFAEQVRDLKA